MMNDVHYAIEQLGKMRIDCIEKMYLFVPFAF